MNLEAESDNNQVKLSISNNISFLATGGRHGYGTQFGKLQNGLEIDMSAFDMVQVDKNSSMMTVGGAVHFGDIVDPLYAAGKEIRECFVKTNELKLKLLSRNGLSHLCRSGRCDARWRHWSLPRTAWTDS